MVLEAIVRELRVPGNPSQQPEQVGNQLLVKGSQVAHFSPESRRLDWQTQLPDDLARRVLGEQRKFDTLAANYEENMVRERLGPWFESGWLQSREISQLLKRHPSLRRVRGLRILDIGGTCPVSWRFVLEGASVVHHVDVSPQTQRVALQRCALHGVDTARIFFHTVPAEQLPFADGSFDLVFSRHSVHHLSRPAAYNEMRRVLAPQGHMLLLEPWLSPILRLAMHARRKALGLDRGTDDPLSHVDLRAIKQRFGSVDSQLHGFGAGLATRSLGRHASLHALLTAWHSLETRRGTLPVVSRVLAMHTWILGSV